uniref:26S proteasome non-ATPase regulatory subunit 2 n=1 Tax=Oncorhynchus tshawytscha TaxID=74940 RepID=A0A8C8CD71_ONCTS
MEEAKNKEKKQSEKTELKETKPTGKDKDKKDEQELSDEDKQLQEELEMMVERLGETDTSLYRPALEELRRQIRSSTTSMTSVPKPLKFLRPHYGKLKEIYEGMVPGENKSFCADVVSVLAMTMSGERECLKYRLLGSQEELASWGHEYVRHLAGEVAKEWQEVEESDKAQQETLLKLVKEIVPYNMAHNAEHEACDLLMEVEKLEMLELYIDDNAYAKVWFGQDKLLTDDGNKWLYKNKDHGMLSAAASLGMILLWDVDGGLTQIDKYLYSSEDYIKSGALLACGIVNSGVRNECDPALALLSDYVLHNSNVMRIGAIFGLGLAYAGSNREDVLSLLLPVMVDSKSSMEVAGVTALACGMIAVGSCNGDVTSTIVQSIMEKSELELKDTYARWLPLGLGLNHLGKGEAIETTLAALQVVPEPFRSFANTLVDVCAYAGSGNVLKVQQLLHICSEHYEAKEKEEEKDKKDKKDKDKKESAADMGSHQGVAVLGIALIAMGEEIGSEMALRAFGHLVRHVGEPTLRRAVPLALALISVSNPRLNILDTLSKFSHDADPEVSHNSIFAMGMVGSGTNNARLAAMLRQLAQYHAKDPNNLFMVRLAQGLTHLGKGTLTLCPYHSDRQLMSQVAVAGLLTVLVSFLDVKNIILGKSHYVLYGLVAAMQPRMLVTFDEELRPLPVSVRVGQAVDVVGQAGKPKAITGFQTHTTPVLLAHGERAELATEEYLPVTPILEGFVILRKNPNYDA